MRSVRLYTVSRICRIRKLVRSMPSISEPAGLDASRIVLSTTGQTRHSPAE